jgi:hypothetical protein
MRKRLLIALFALSLTTPLLAAPTITSVIPAEGPASGGTTVTITGTGFGECTICSPRTPPEVLFGSTEAESVTLVNETTLRVVTPPRPPGLVQVTVSQFDGAATRGNAFTYTGDIEEGFERILVPVFSPPVQGAFGSEFRTILRASNTGSQPNRVALYGLDSTCILVQPVLGPNDPRLINNDATTQELTPECSQWPARFFYVPSSVAGNLTMNLRVRDTSRSDLSHGTEIPVVRESEFKDGRLVLLGVPIDNTRFRNTLRIYATEPGFVAVTIGDQVRAVELLAGRNEFEPAFAMLGNYPGPGEIEAPGRDTVRIMIEAMPAPGGITTPIPSAKPIWAFVSVTNNVTQEITVVTPD